MRMGTSPTHVFTLPFSVDLVEVVRVIYAQNGKAVLELDEDDCTLDGNTIKAHIAQESTFMFTAGVNVEIQLRVRTSDGNAMASNIICVSCERCLSEDVI